MATLSLPLLQPAAPPRSAAPSVALIGNPNTGKTCLFNALTGLRAKTANFPGTTVDVRLGRVDILGEPVSLVDLPGLYGLDAVTPDERVAEQALMGELPGQPAPDVVLAVLDATNLERGLFLGSQVLALQRPTVVALTMVDCARRARVRVDPDRLARELGVEVVPVCARTGEGLAALRSALGRALAIGAVPAPVEAPACNACGGCPYSARYGWAEGVASRCGSGRTEAHGRGTEAIDRVLTHPVVGLGMFFSVMAGMFYLVFALADVPMGLIEAGFAWVGDALAAVLPDGTLRSLLVDGVIGGVGGVLVFLPQIAILFFVITLLEDTGYMARAAFVMDRLMRRVGLPGKAFVPMLSAHACAVPAIMASRIIEDWRDRLVTILVLPLMTCSARLPVYTMIIVLLLGDRPGLAAALLTAAYALGIVAALSMALLFKKTILPGQTRPLVIELPNYRLPSLKNALLAMWDRSRLFVRKAGTVILLISIGLWVLATYPRLPAEAVPAGLASAVAAGAEGAQTRLAQAELEYSLAGRMGKAVEPAFRPLGFNWQINVGVLSSFAAREVIVSTLGIVYGLGADAAEETATMAQTLQAQKHPDGRPVFGVPTALSLLVFYVLAMQCLPTQAITRRETGRWAWPVFQFAYMSLLAYGAALLTFQLASWLG